MGAIRGMGGEATDRDGSQREGGAGDSLSSRAYGAGASSIEQLSGGASYRTRVDVMVHLVEGMRTALRSGDMVAVQACHAALGRLLG